MTGSEEVTPTLRMDDDHQCPACDRPALTVGWVYAMTSGAVHVIGGVGLCAVCAWSPYRHGTTPWPTTQEPQ
ncbi:hypothetical protein J4H86_21225 [Spiractinospora alimapuensis]|uniref:hypothetical protein n=1 Tax=Spiractinospora alimapuensis TaxID=2820884 RepID=UPI001F18D731|nr:hypothetical protein [Spiractinospora alimapuensis]QVQ51313.1 hypothetical protein J4H86_21225 [Spiractinospora alimapuensis]